MKSNIPFPKVVKVLKKFDAPDEMLAKYFNLIDDIESRVSLAKEYRMHQIVIDVRTFLYAIFLI